MFYPVVCIHWIILFLAMMNKRFHDETLETALQLFPTSVFICQTELLNRMTFNYINDRLQFITSTNGKGV